MKLALYLEDYPNIDLLEPSEKPSYTRFFTCAKAQILAAEYLHHPGHLLQWHEFFL
jgi:hypothetical protein